MLAHSDFAKPVGSFRQPVTVPTEDPDSGEQICVQFSKSWLPYILGALYQLYLQSTWDTTDEQILTNTQSRVYILLDLFMAGVTCGGTMEIAACDDPDCGIKWRNGPTDEWTCINLGGCIADIVGIGIDNAITDGLLGQGTISQPPTERPPTGECKTYHVQLAPGAKWHAPQAVIGGDTIHITNAQGAWSIGELAWYCPDGNRYLLGTCDATLQTHVAGDLLNPGAFHMALIGLIGSTYFDPQTGSYAIPSSVPLSDLFIMANTNLTSTPSGQIEFDVEICSGGAWSHTIDMNSGLDSWSIYLSYGSWDGTKWVATSGGGSTWALYVGYLLPTNAASTYSSVVAVATNGSATDNIRLYNTGLFSGTVLATGNCPQGMTFPANHHGGKWLCISPDSNANVQGTLTSVTIYGYGTNPF